MDEKADSVRVDSRLNLGRLCRLGVVERPADGVALDILSAIVSLICGETGKGTDSFS